MASAVFDYEDFHRLIERFAAEIPSVLARHASTADLVPRVEGLLNSLDSPFTLAVVGQMRVGKSSLLNALVGTDLAVTGVNETTATINWFKHGSPEQLGRFRVVWKDRPTEEFPASEISQWVGNSELAKATRYLEFYSDAEFLKVANIVDTPGTRSVIESHEQAIQEFLSARHDAETRRQGGAADAILYVLMPVGRQTDQELLANFEQHSRLPGSTPYNSIAVVHKWETLSVPDPLSDARSKASNLERTMGNLISAVFPVSAPLGWAAAMFPDPFWVQVLALGAETPADALNDLLETDRAFAISEESACPLDASMRRRLREEFKLPWPSFKAMLRVAQSCPAPDIGGLREAVAEAGGINRLRAELERRFFARSRMIKAFSILAKAWEPCQIANTRLRNHKLRFGRLLEDARRAGESLSQQGELAATDLAPIQCYLDETRELVEVDLKTASDALRQLGETTIEVQDAYQDMDADVGMLERLGQQTLGISETLVGKLRYLFGYGGPEIAKRIAPLAAGPDVAGIDHVLSALGELRRALPSSQGDAKLVLEHAILRLEQIADWLNDCSSVKASV